MRLTSLALALCVLSLTACSRSKAPDDQTGAAVSSAAASSSRGYETGAQKLARLIANNESMIASLTEEGWVQLHEGEVRGSFESQKIANRFTFNISLDSLPEGHAEELEGWLIRSTPYGLIRMGRFTKLDDRYVMSFTTEENVGDYSYFLLAEASEDPEMFGRVLTSHKLEW